MKHIMALACERLAMCDTTRAVGPVICSFGCEPLHQVHCQVRHMMVRQDLDNYSSVSASPLELEPESIIPFMLEFVRHGLKIPGHSKRCLLEAWVG